MDLVTGSADGNNGGQVLPPYSLFSLSGFQGAVERRAATGREKSGQLWVHVHLLRQTTQRHHVPRLERRGWAHDAPLR